DYSGGFGGGGGVTSCTVGGGGGGGYSGGAGGQQLNHCTPGIGRSGGGGGGSINNGTNTSAQIRAQAGQGFANFAPLSSPAHNDAGIESVVSPLLAPASCAGTYSVDVMIRNFGGNQINSLTVDW